MKDALLILGAGGHGKVVADAALLQGQWSEIAFLDNAPPAQAVLGLPVLDGSQPLARLRERYGSAAVAIGDADRRMARLDELQREGFELPLIQHPSAIVSPFAELEAGCVVFANSVINAGSRLGRGCILNTAASIDHDCTLGDGVHIAPGARIAGGVRIGARSWIGIGACVREYIAIGDNVTVGAGAAVVNDVAAGRIVRGVPARDYGKA